MIDPEARMGLAARYGGVNVESNASHCSSRNLGHSRLDAAEAPVLNLHKFIPVLDV